MLRDVRLAFVLAAAPARFKHLPAFLHLAGDGQDAQGFIVQLLEVVSARQRQTVVESVQPLLALWPFLFHWFA